MLKGQNPHVHGTGQVLLAPLSRVPPSPLNLFLIRALYELDTDCAGQTSVNRQRRRMIMSRSAML